MSSDPRSAVSLERVAAELVARHPKNIHLGVAVDGSSISEKATSVAARFFDTRRQDKLTILHISDPSKTYLPPHLQPTHLRHYYEDLAGASRVPSEWLCRAKEDDQSTCRALTNLAEKNNIDILVMGSYGRKGEKLEMLGTVSDGALRESHASICIVRATSSQKIGRVCKWLFATDGSHAAAIAFCVLINKLRKPDDIINVVLVTTRDGEQEKQVVAEYSKFMLDHKAVGDAYVKCIDVVTTTIPEGILEAVKEADPDILVMGISGYGKKKLGSVSEQVTMHASCSTLIIKDSYEVDNKHFSKAGAQTLGSELIR